MAKTCQDQTALNKYSDPESILSEKEIYSTQATYIGIVLLAVNFHLNLFSILVINNENTN